MGLISDDDLDLDIDAGFAIAVDLVSGFAPVAPVATAENDSKDEDDEGKSESGASKH